MGDGNWEEDGRFSLRYECVGYELRNERVVLEKVCAEFEEAEFEELELTIKDL